MSIFPFRVGVTMPDTNNYEGLCLGFKGDNAVVMIDRPGYSLHNHLISVRISRLVVFDEEALCFEAMTPTAQAHWVKKEKEKLYKQMDKKAPPESESLTLPLHIDGTDVPEGGIKPEGTPLDTKIDDREYPDA